MDPTGTVAGENALVLSHEYLVERAVGKAKLDALVGELVRGQFLLPTDLGYRVRLPGPPSAPS